MIKNCLLCKNYCQHSCECEHCENYERFKISKEGKELYKKIIEEIKGNNNEI